eukprot:scaffold567278_cov41-Prasinocladus_malaysianus.AAC.1
MPNPGRNGSMPPPNNRANPSRPIGNAPQQTYAPGGDNLGRGMGRQDGYGGGMGMPGQQNMPQQGQPDRGGGMGYNGMNP